MKILLSVLILGGVSMTTMAQDGQTVNSEMIKRGEYVAQMGGCVACHTRQGGQPFAGGLPMATPVGTLYTTNITPDKQYGIGNYRFEDFDNALRRGVRKDNSTLYPAMPFPSYAVITESDMRALYVYMMNGVKPVAQVNKANDIPWPLSMRWPLAIWRAMFAPQVKDFAAKAHEDPILARGRYLVEGLGHCGACHTPRGFMMQEKALNDREGTVWLSGGAPIDGWVAVNLRGDDMTGLGRWSEDALVQFLRTGRNDHSAVFGSMSDVVEYSLQYLTDADALAVARYLKSLKPADATKPSFRSDDTMAKALLKGDDSQTGAALYIDNCAACHKTDGSGYQRFFPALRGNPVVLSEDPTSLIHIVLTGYTLPGVRHAPSSITMPPFGWRLNDGQVADVVSFIRTSWGNQAAGVSADEVKKVRHDETAIPQRKLLGNADLDKLLKEPR